MEWHKIYAMSSRGLVVCLMLLSAVQAAPMPPSTLDTESILLASSPSYDEVVKVTSPTFNRLPHRSNDALKYLLENSRTTQETSKPIISATTTTALEGRARENFDDQYFEAATTKQSFDYDVSTTHYIGGRMPSVPNSEEVETETTTYFIVKTTAQPTTTLPITTASVLPISVLSVATIEASTAKTFSKTTSTPFKVIDFEYVENARRTYSPYSPSSPYPETSFLSTLSSQGYEKNIKVTDEEKIESKSTTTKVVESASTTTEGVLSASTTTTITTDAITEPQAVASSSSSSSTATTITTSPAAAAVAKKFPAKINMSSEGSKGSSSISKKKSGITIMGHDGVKVTRKKQLLEKSYRDDAATERRTNRIMEPIASTEVGEATTMESVVMTDSGGIHVPSIDAFTENFRKMHKIMEPAMENLHAVKETESGMEVTDDNVHVVSSQGLIDIITVASYTTEISNNSALNNIMNYTGNLREYVQSNPSSTTNINVDRVTSSLFTTNQPNANAILTVKPAVTAEPQAFQSQPADQTSTTAASETSNLYRMNETDILVVEITSADNITGDVANNEDPYNVNPNPKFTIHNDGISEYDSGNTRPYSGVEIDYESSKSQPDDDIFVPDLKMAPIEDFSPITVSAQGNVGGYNSRDTIDRDSDTIFYISNTEVKVVESKPTQNSSPLNGRQNHEKQSYDSESSYDSRRTNLESQFYPAIYEEDVIIDFPAKNITYNGIQKGGGGKSERYEEDIILSPLKNNFDPLKIITNRNDDIQNANWLEQQKQSNLIDMDNNMSGSYVGEKLIEVEPSQTDSPITFPDPNPNSESVLEVNESLIPISDVIIQPANIPEMAIGVPIIGELPPQIELKEIDFLVTNGETASASSSSGGRASSSSFNGDSNNEPSNEKLEGGIQYGGDLIARDGVMNSGYDIDTDYVFGGSRHRSSENRGGSSVNPIRTNREKDRNDFNVGREIDSAGRFSDVTIASQIFMHAVDNLQKDQLIADVQGGFKDLPLKRNNGTTAENLTNATAYSVMDEAETEFNFTDIQTLFLACFATLVPLILSVLLAFGLRYLWRKYRPGPSGGGMMGDNSTDPLAAKSMTMSQDELKSTESGLTINRSNDTLESSTEIDMKRDDRLIYRCPVANDPIETTPNGMITSTSNHSGANGSVITMTLKNNHLIVETEERNDISRDARETKMHYTPSEKDGVFVVEVARGADSAGIPGSPRKNSEARPLNHTLDIDQIEKLPNNDLKSTNHEEVQIHQPPREGANDDETIVDVEDTNVLLKSEPPTNLGSSNTGLSQSDLSTSSADSNKCYAYGNQQLYTVDTKGYHPPSPKVNIASAKISSLGKSDVDECSPGENDGCSKASGGFIAVAPKLDSETKPIITAALLKQDTVIEINENCGMGRKFNGKDIRETNGVEMVDGSGDTFEGTNGDVIDQKKDNNNYNKDPNTDHQDEQHQLGNGDIRTSVIDNNSQQENGTGKAPGNGTENGTENGEDTTIDVENGFDSIISLPAPPSSDEIKQFNDVILMDSNQLDSLPPPPPPVEGQMVVTSHDNANGHTIDGQNGVAVPVAIAGNS